MLDRATDGKRVGVVVPAPNTVIEDDLRRCFTRGEQIYVARMPLERDSPEELAQLADLGIEAVKSLRGTGSTLAVFACMTGSLFGGRAYDANLKSQIEEVIRGEAITTASAVVHALLALNVRRVALVSPYEGWLVRHVERYLAEWSIAVVGGVNFARPLPREIERLTSDEIVRAIEESISGTDAEGVLVACTGMHGLEASASMWGRSSVPVVASNQATIWEMVKATAWQVDARWLGSLSQALLDNSSAGHVGAEAGVTEFGQ